MAPENSCAGLTRKASGSIIASTANQRALSCSATRSKIGRRGSLNGTLIVAGRQGHAAYPEWADNPIPKLFRPLDALTAAALDKGTPRFDATNLGIVSVDVGNPSFNVIPAEARARFKIRVNDLWNAGDTWRRAAAQAIERGVSAVVAWASEPLAPQSAVVRARPV
jgi:succinyl-diaminopimelate desuccinylase